MTRYKVGLTVKKRIIPAKKTRVEVVDYLLHVRSALYFTMETEAFVRAFRAALHETTPTKAAPAPVTPELPMVNGYPSQVWMVSVVHEK